MKYALLMLLALGACEKKQTAPPSIDKVDRSCTVDADCTLTGYLGCCDRSCGKNVGYSVNAKAWYKVSASFRAECKEECNVMCQKLPDCRDEQIAVCKSGVCDIATKKTAACEAQPECTTGEDCEVVVEGDNCCTTCGRVMSKAAAAKYREEVAKKCSAEKKYNCPKLDCMRVEGTCIDNKCVQL